jgi:hypothetical protein
MERLIHEIRRKRPGYAKRADKGSRSCAIRLFCIECMGGVSAEVKKCEATDCPLHSFRMGKKIEDGDD